MLELQKAGLVEHLGITGLGDPAALVEVLGSGQFATVQAPQFSRSPEDEMHLLTIHGILHLLGYDHAEPEEEREMFGLQARLLAEWQGVRSGEDVE